LRFALRSFTLPAWAAEGSKAMLKMLPPVLRRGFAGVLFAAGLAFAGAAAAGGSVLKGPPAPWVEEIALPQADPASLDRVQNGIAYLLADTQFKHTEAGYTIWDRFAYTVTDRTGLEQAAAINVTFDPSRETVTLNRLTVIRDGAALDRTAEAAIDVFRRERRAEQGIFDGWLTANINLPDVRVGDTIDYAVTYEETPFFPGAPFRDRFAVAWSAPVALIRRKITWPKDEPLQVRTARTNIAPLVRDEGGDTVRLWEIRNPQPFARIENLPPGTAEAGLVEVSAAKDWTGIVRSLEDVYRPVGDLPAAFAARLDAIAARSPAPEDRLVAATRLVQDEIRYVSLSIGTGSYLPRRPDLVLASGLGDCKDKALLLASALQHLGIKASVALTDLDEGRGLAAVLPSAAAFDHAVVKAAIGPKVYWIDATDYLQGGRADTLAQADYGFALPIEPATTGLQAMARQLPEQPTTQVFERFRMPDAPGRPVDFAVTTIYRDADADGMRRRLRSESIAAMRERYGRFYSGTYPGMASIAPLAVTDDRDANVVTVLERYQMPFEALHADKFIEKFPMRLDIGYDRLPRPAAQGRTDPVWIGGKVAHQHTVTVDNLKAAFTPPEDSEVSSPYLSLKLTPRVTPTRFELEWTFRTTAEEVPPGDVAAYLADVERIRSDDGITYDFGYVEPAPAAAPPAGEGRPEEPPSAAGPGWRTKLDAFLARAAKARPASGGTN
jgi:transglutaminase-like putative cysteine protease